MPKEQQLCYPILWLWRVKSGEIYGRNRCRYTGKIGRWSDDTDDDDDDYYDYDDASSWRPSLADE